MMLHVLALQQLPTQARTDGDHGDASFATIDCSTDSNNCAMGEGAEPLYQVI